MAADATLLPLVLALAMVSFACRAGGYLLMRYVPLTPRLGAALRATPIAVMIGIVAPVAASGRLPELVALAVILLVTRVAGNDVVAAFAGIAAVALMRNLA
jgi:uncharacterized membrane protein